VTSQKIRYKDYERTYDDLVFTVVDPKSCKMNLPGTDEKANRKGCKKVLEDAAAAKAKKEKEKAAAEKKEALKK
jgi:hypothetical protein